MRAFQLAVGTVVCSAIYQGQDEGFLKSNSPAIAESNQPELELPSDVEMEQNLKEVAKQMLDGAFQMVAELSSGEKLEEMRQKVAELTADVVGDDVVKREDIREILPKSQDNDEVEDQVEKVFDNVDANGDGVVTSQEVANKVMEMGENLLANLKEGLDQAQQGLKNNEGKAL